MSQGIDVQIDNLLDFYREQGFDLVPIAYNKKNPIESDWPNKHHKDKIEWLEWLHQGNNIGVKTGKISNIIVLDFDKKPIPEQVRQIIEDSDTLVQETNKGFHVFYKYMEDFHKCRVAKFKMDLQTDGGQVVIAPSIVNGEIRELLTKEIKEMPKELFEILKNSSPLRTVSMPTSEKEFENLKPFEKPKIDEEEIDINFDPSKIDVQTIEEGNRNNAFMMLGGVLRSDLNMYQTRKVLSIFNQYFCKPSLDNREFESIVRSLEKYYNFDEKVVAEKVYDYLRMVGEANSRDIQDALKLKKELVDKVTSFLLKEGYVYRKSRMFYATRKAEWKTDFSTEGLPVKYKMPYFYDAATFRDGDMILIAGTQKCGKSHIAMNMIKELVEQGVSPFYISLESGNRFASISKTLQLHEGDFKWCVHYSPETIELEKDAVTIIDWLLPENHAETDKLYKYFSEQLARKKGQLIIFAQLKDDGSYFSKNMIAQFPAFVCRYFYDSEDGSSGYFQVDYMREPLRQGKTRKIACHYDFVTKRLNRVEE